MTGTLGTVGCWSLNVAKTLPAGQGGLIAVHDAALIERIATFARSGELPVHQTADFDGVKPYITSALGYSYGISEFHAALARSQMTRLEDNIALATLNAELLNRNLAGLPLTTPTVVPGGTSTWHKYRLALDPIWTAAVSQRHDDMPYRMLTNAVVMALRAEGVDATGWQTMALPYQPLIQQRFGPTGEEDYPVAVDLLTRSFILGSEQTPIGVQTPTLMRSYANAIGAVLADIDAVIGAAFTRKE